MLIMYLQVPHKTLTIYHNQPWTKKEGYVMTKQEWCRKSLFDDWPPVFIDDYVFQFGVLIDFFVGVRPRQPNSKKMKMDDFFEDLKKADCIDRPNHNAPSSIIHRHSQYFCPDGNKPHHSYFFDDKLNTLQWKRTQKGLLTIFKIECA